MKIDRVLVTTRTSTRTTTESALIDDGTSTEMVYFYWFGLLLQM